MYCYNVHEIQQIDEMVKNLIELLIIADDLTGALDTSVQFAKASVDTRLVIDAERMFDGLADDARVLVVSSETRHLSPSEAYRIIYDLTSRAIEAGVQMIYKKTDSVLRGNVGSELQALLCASHAQYLPFVPAFPELGRTTRNGVQYVNGIPIHESVFGSDPFEPVTDAYIPALIARQSAVPSACVQDADGFAALMQRGFRGVMIFDCQTTPQMRRIVGCLAGNQRPMILSGCAGCAMALAEWFGQRPHSRHRHSEEKLWPQAPGMLVISGSLNPVTHRQIDFAIHHGFVQVPLDDRQKFQVGYFASREGRDFVKYLMNMYAANPHLILASERMETEPVPEGRSRVSENLGCLARALLEQGMEGTLFVIGGDTLMGVLRELGCHSMRPLREFLPGTVLSCASAQGREFYIVSKSGGFGDEHLLVNIRQIIQRRQQKELRYPHA